MEPFYRGPSPERSGAVARLVRNLRSLVIITGLALGCARVSPQAVTLADLVDQRLAATQQSHEAFVQGYFAQSRAHLERFLAEHWTPYFLEQFVEDADGHGQGLLTMLEQATPFDDEQVARLEASFRKHGVAEAAVAVRAAADALGGGERGELTLAFAEAAIGEIEKKRRALFDPINKLEQRALAELRRSYAQIRQAQSTVTTHLRSLVDVQAQQDHLLEQTHLAEKRDRVIERAINVNEGITGVIEAGADVVETLEALEKSIDDAEERSNPDAR